MGSKPRRWWPLLLVALLLLAGPVAADGDDGDDDDVTTEILLVLAPGVELSTIEARYGVTSVESVPELGFWKVRVASGADAQTVVGLMEDDPDLLEVERHREVDIPEGVQRSIPILGIGSLEDFRSQPALTTIRYAPAASRHTGSGVVVAILDTGINLDHPQVAGLTTLDGRDFVDDDNSPFPAGNGLDDDGDGQIDEALHHGTYVAGLLWLTAPGVRVLPLRVLDAEGTGTSFDLARGIVYAAQAGADVINISVALADESFIVERALEEAKRHGVVMVAAAGNSGTEGVLFPASESEVVAVAAVDALLRRAEFSSYGSKVDLSAPGVDLLSTFGTSDFAGWEGTSFATPLVTGGAALLLERYPGLEPDEVRNVLRATARPDFSDPADAGRLGAGILDLDALTLAETDDVTSLAAPSPGVFAFSPILGAASYDIVRGELDRLDRAPSSDGLRPTDLGAVTCIGEDSVDTTFVDTAVPEPGQGFFYLFRAAGAGYDLPDVVQRTAGAGDCSTD